MSCRREEALRAARALALAAVLGGTLAPSSSRALVVIKRDFAELVARAEQVVIGTAVDVHESTDERGVPYTFVTFDDLAVLKGEVGQTLTLRFYGGRSGRFATRVPDMPEFTPGDRAVLFVRGNGHDICPLVGVWQGRFRVRYDAGLGAEIVADSDGRPIVGVSRGRVHVGSAGGRAASLPMTLDEFRQVVADELAAPGASAEEE